jgi:1-acyl-sn-glycerol-3-phosphate acyltransferase
VTHDYESGSYRLARAVLRTSLRLVTNQDWIGQENIPATGGCVLAANHVSHFDPPAFAHFVNDAGRAPRFLAKESLFRIPLIGRVVNGAGQIPVHRDSKDAALAFRDAVAAVRDGQCVVIYPEATLTRDPKLWPMAGKTGAARVALSTGCPVIPCAQWGAQEVVAPYAKTPHLFPRKTMHIAAGEPVALDDLRDRELSTAVLRLATSRIMADIIALLAQLRREQPPLSSNDHVLRTDPDGHPRGEVV